jgi:glycine/D-amino acid oxidase-like deaminating enzyme
VRVVSLDGRSVSLGDGTTLAAGLSVNATGAWAPELTPGLEVRKRKGHLVSAECLEGFARHELIELGYLKSAHGAEADSVAFVVQPRPGGLLLIGSSREFGADDPAVEPSVLRRMLDRATEYMPGLAGLTPGRVWTGFRAATPDNLPLIGPCPGREGLYLATGHEGLGITTSLATACLLADQVLGRAPAIPVGPYLPARSPQEAAHP